MNTSLYISSGALQAFQQKLDTSANNIANVNTTGFKRRDQSFSEILASQINNQTRSDQEVGRLTPNGIREGYGVRAGLTQLDMEQGQAMETDKPFDLMINGNGFFQVSSSANGVTSTHYTRDGDFHLSPDPNQAGSYNLVNSNGSKLLDQNGTPIKLNGKYDVQITTNGQIQVKSKTGNGAVSILPQRIGIVDIKNPQILQNAGGNEYSIDSNVLPAGSNVASYVRTMAPGETQIQSGFLEGSNVDLTQEMTDTMTSQRGFQMNARAVSYADEMQGIADNIIKN
ncbi:flagellar hook-basal body protein [Bacillus sp. BRMEA1]|uniref:flagellar hook-basal body protein n=1 Tax=Neobacillus endophyticus TaxID=2738405 RepID=UPI001565D952|nr:flagellar hook-basal body protein [Neobacillus endophyticus]NRD79378.1 flagellar hook-basal body protein [Neobacillus endophyticus]